VTAAETAPAERHMGEGLLERLANLSDTECDFAGRGFAGYEDGFAIRLAAREAASGLHRDGLRILDRDGYVLAHAVDDWSASQLLTRLAATPTALPSAEDALREAIARIDMQGLAEAIHNGRFNGPVTEPYADEREAGKLYCTRIANSVAAYLDAALQSPRASDEVLAAVSGAVRELSKDEQLTIRRLQTVVDAGFAPRPDSAHVNDVKNALALIQRLSGQEGE
jgi:hypothetical protein